MAQLTKIGDSKSKKRNAIYVDGNFVCFLDSFTVFKYKLKENQDIDIDFLQEIQAESEQDTAFNLAITYVSKYVKTEKEIAEYLKNKGFLPLVIQNTMQKIKDYKYVNDEFIASNFVNMKSDKYGKQKLKFMLKNRGVSDKNIEESLENIDEYKNALLVAHKYMKNKEKNIENFTRMSKFLASRGFCWEDIGKVMNEIKKGEDYESWN